MLYTSGMLGSPETEGINMPWKEERVMDQRNDACRRVRCLGRSVTDVAKEYGVSRQNLHMWLRRFDEQGRDGMADQSRRPRRSPNQTPPDVEKLVLDLRDERPTWGPLKLRHRLVEMGFKELPSERTVARILKRNGRVGEPKPAEEPVQRFEREEPNQLWQIDFKKRLYLPGKPRVRVMPMTIIDDCSRFNIRLQANQNSRFPTVWPVLWDAMGEYGLPDAILTDNDSIFRGHKGGTTRFTAYLIRLNIRHSSGRAYHPQTQGKVERLHGTIQRDVLNSHQCTTVEELQAAFDQFRDVYNYERPHQALGMDVPGEHYRPSSRKRPDDLPEIDYPEGAQLRKVWQNGAIKLRGGRVHIGEGLAGEHVQIVDRDDEFDVLYGTCVIRTLRWDQLTPDHYV
jgi:transposase InsO family protein